MLFRGYEPRTTEDPDAAYPAYPGMLVLTRANGHIWPLCPAPATGLLQGLCYRGYAAGAMLQGLCCRGYAAGAICCKGYAKPSKHVVRRKTRGPDKWEEGVGVKRVRGEKRGERGRIERKRSKNGLGSPFSSETRAPPPPVPVGGAACKSAARGRQSLVKIVI